MLMTIHLVKTSYTYIYIRIYIYTEREMGIFYNQMEISPHVRMQRKDVKKRNTT